MLGFEFHLGSNCLRTGDSELENQLCSTFFFNCSCILQTGKQELPGSSPNFSVICFCSLDKRTGSSGFKPQKEPTGLEKRRFIVRIPTWSNNR